MRIGIRKIRTKVALYVLLLLAVTILVSYLIISRIMDNRIRGEIINRAESISRTIAAAAGYSLLSQDLVGLDSIVFTAKKSNPDIEYIAIADPERRAVVHSDMKKAGERLIPAERRVLATGENKSVVTEVAGVAGKIFEIETPIVFMDKKLGSVVLGINRSVLSTARAETRRRIVWIFVFILGFGAVSSILLSTFLTRPVKQLASGVEEMKADKRSKPLRVYSRDELGRLTENFNDMTALITVQRDKLVKYAGDLEESYVATVRVLAAAIDARDTYTLGHSARVSQLSTAIAREMGFGEGQVEEVEIASLFHDVGKIKMPDSILHKGGRLDQDERREMMRHPEYGAEILTKAQSLFKYIPPVRHHHEWFDGSGYPDGLAGDRIPVAAAIVSLADAYDAMTSDRPYRTAMTREEALAKIAEFSGKQFDPAIVRVFLKIIDELQARETAAQADPSGSLRDQGMPGDEGDG
jgi:putative nucleotidyltransferase with HDIG domain